MTDKTYVPWCPHCACPVLWRLGLALGCVLLLGGLLVNAGWPPHGTATVPGPQRCSQGGQTYNITTGPPGLISAWWTTNPCGNLQSPELLDNGGGTRYGDHWRSAVGVNSVASSPNSMTNGKAWVRWRYDSTSQIWCFRIYPTLGTSWFKANGTVC